MSIRKMAAQAAILQALFLIATVVIYMAVLPSMGMQMSDWNDPNKMAQFYIAHKSVFICYYFFDWVFGITTFVLAAAFTQRFSRRQPWLGIMLGGWGVMSAALFLLAGTAGVLGTPAAIHDYTAHQSVAFAMTLQQIQFIVESTAIGAVGVVVFCAALASARTKAFGAFLNWCGYLTGIFYVASVVLSAISMSLGFIGFLGVITAIVFNVGVAMHFIKQPNPELQLAPQA